MGEPTEEMKKRFAKHEETRKAYNAELKKIMTAEQYSKYEADEAKHRAMHPRRGGHGPKGKKE
jgi:Spy/CpxP family protein refolding chaperone